jgi:hypothetical protein
MWMQSKRPLLAQRVVYVKQRDLLCWPGEGPSRTAPTSPASRISPNDRRTATG